MKTQFMIWMLVNTYNIDNMYEQYKRLNDKLNNIWFKNQTSQIGLLAVKWLKFYQNWQRKLLQLTAQGIYKNSKKEFQDAENVIFLWISLWKFTLMKIWMPYISSYFRAYKNLTFITKIKHLLKKRCNSNISTQCTCSFQTIVD